MDLTRIESILQKECGIGKDRTLVVGVSGGADSLCLLGVLRELGYPLVVAHFDHRLRPDSGEDARRVAAIAAGYGLEVAIGAEDVRALAAAGRLSLEEAARLARYRFLFAQARDRGAQAVAVAHTADDQVETVLMHLLRGTGLAGLKGMQPCNRLAEFDERIPLVRPLLETWREETEAYCRSLGIAPAIDPSNADVTFFRNRLRHELIPTLQQYNPRVKEGFVRMARTLAGDYAVLEQAAAEAFDESLHARGAGYLAFDRAALGALPDGLARGVIRRAVGELRPALRDIDFAAASRALEFIQAPPATRHADLVDGLDLDLEEEWVILREHAARLPALAWPQVGEGELLDLPVPGEASLAGGWRLEAEVIASEKLAQSWKDECDPNRAWLDGSLTGEKLTVRARRPGDRFAPLGMNGKTVKVSDLFVNLKTPRRARDGWPLVCAGETVVWVAGLRTGEAYRVRAEMARVVRLTLRKEDGPAQ
jgi:tRNA(Ile)-lysidine synthase